MYLKEKVSEQRWIVLYGPKKENERETRFFNDEESALEFFRKKEAINMYVDVYLEETTIKLTRLTKPHE